MKRMVGLGQEKITAQLLHNLNNQTCTGVLHCLQFSSYNRKLVLIEMSAAQALMLALYHSLLEEDLALCSTLIAASCILEHLKSRSIMVWMTDDFNFPTDDVIKVVRTMAHFKEKGLVDFPDHIVRVFVSLAKRYSVDAKFYDLQDNVTLRFLTNYDDKSTHDMGTTTNEISPCFKSPKGEKEFSNIRNTVELLPFNVQKSSEVEKLKKDQNLESGVNQILQYSLLEPFSTTPIVKHNDTNQLTALHLAAQNGECSMLKELLSRGADPEVKEGRYGNTAVHWAIKKDNVDILYWLQRYGANISDRNYQGLTPLHLAAESGKTRSLIWLLNNGVYIDIVDDIYMTPLSRAAERGQLLTVRILLDRGASIDHCDQNMRTPLYLAVLGGHHCVVRLLLERGADTSMRDKWSKTLLHAAVASGDLITFHFILKQAIDIDAKDSSGRTALHDASETANDLALTLLKEKKRTKIES